MLEEVGSLAPDIVKRKRSLVRESKKEKTNIIPFVKKDRIAIITSVAEMVIGILRKSEFPYHTFQYNSLDVRRLTNGGVW